MRIRWRHRKVRDQQDGGHSVWDDGMGGKYEGGKQEGCGWGKWGKGRGKGRKWRGCGSADAEDGEPGVFGKAKRFIRQMMGKGCKGKWSKGKAGEGNQGAASCANDDEQA